MKWAGLSQVKLSFRLQTDSSEPIIKQSASGDDFQQELSCLSLVRILDDNDCKMQRWSMILDNEIFSLLMTQVAASNIVQHLLWMQATAHNFLFSLTDTAAGGSSCLERQNSKFMRLTSHTHYTQITAENKTLTQHICMLTCDNNYTEIFISHFCKTRLTMVSVLQRQSSATTNIRIHPGSCLYRK